MAKHRQLDKEEILRRQLFGKEVMIPQGKKNTSSGFTFKAENLSSSSKSEVSPDDFSYIKRDFLKIALLSFLAIGSQLLLYFAIQNHVIKLPFFG